MERYTVKQARLLAGKTQEQAAKVLNVCTDTYRAIEADPERATIRQAVDLSNFFGIHYDSILFSRRL